jgi:hypothetical protein
VAIFIFSCLSWSAHSNEKPKEEAHGEGHEVQSKGEHGSEHELPIRSAKTSSRDVKVPEALVKKIEEEFHSYLKAQKIGEKGPIRRHMLNLSVQLTQERPIALHEAVQIDTPTGGGVIDLSDFLTPLRGSFRLKLIAKTDKDHVAENLRVVFISGAKHRVVDGQDFGAGCSKYMEVTSYLNKSSSGLTLYTADQRYLSVIGGTFVLFSFSPEGISVGSVTFGDSRFPEVLCG